MLSFFPVAEALMSLIYHRPSGGNSTIFFPAEIETNVTRKFHLIVLMLFGDTELVVGVLILSKSFTNHWSFLRW